MTEEIINLPTGPELEKKNEGLDFLPGDNWAGVDVNPYILDFETPYKPPQYTLSWKGIPFAPIRGIHNITGQSGNGKTMTIAQFMAAILCGEVGNLKREFNFVERERTSIDPATCNEVVEVEKVPPKLLYIDTEMEEDNTIAVKNRVLTMAGRNVGQSYDDFIVVMLRDIIEIPMLDEKGNKRLDRNGRPMFYNPAIARWMMILKAIWMYKPTNIFIDGLLDVVADFNDNIECQSLIFKCMKVAVHYQASLWCVLHQNPGGEKLVGHLGSFLERKVTDVIQTKKCKDETTGEITFEVKQRKARSRDFDDWKFRVTSDTSWGMPEQIDTPNINLKHTPDDVKEILAEHQGDIEWPATLSDIRKVIKTAGIKNNSDVQECMKIATNRRFLIPQSPDELVKGQNYPKYYLNLEGEGAPF